MNFHETKNISTSAAGDATRRLCRDLENEEE
jgi:hypothetical protein